MLNLFDRLLNKLNLYIEDGAENAGGDSSKTEEKEEAKETLDEKIQKAAEKVEGKDKKTDDKEEEKEEDEEKEEEEEDLDEVQTAQAKQLFKVLQNPATSREALLTLVRAAGIDVKEAPTKEEEKEVKKTIKEVVKARLGEKYKFLSEDLGEVLQDLFDEFKEESTKDIRAKIDAREAKEAEALIKTAYDEALAQYTNVDEKVLKEVLRIQKDGELVLGEKTNPKNYFRAAFNMAAENIGVTLSKKVAPKQEKTAVPPKKDTTLARLHAQGGEHKDAVKSTQNKTLDSVIEEAAKRVEEKMAAK